MENQKIELKNIPNIFSKENKDDKLKLKCGRARIITINLPFYLNIDIAKMFGMLFDGSLSKKLNNIMFSQKKDPKKMDEIEEIISRRFGLTPKKEFRNNGDIIVRVSNKTFSKFLYYVLDF